MSTTLIGPAWSTTATPLVDAGRFPLGVEAATLTNSARLVPLVNSGTAHPRYLLLHHAIARSNPAGAGQADRLEATRQLVRRAEVVLGAASLRHAETSPGEHHASAPSSAPASLFATDLVIPDWVGEHSTP